MKLLSKKEHWDNNYSLSNSACDLSWVPKSYDSVIIAKILQKAFISDKPFQKVMEVGCGNSAWLPYLGSIYNAVVLGMDYSENGCILAKKRLNDAGIEGTIICDDFFNIDPDIFEKQDIVFSLGFVEHFSDLNLTIEKKSNFLNSGGILLTEIPNMKHSIHGLMSWIYQPEIYRMHCLISKTDLIQAYESNNIEVIECNYAGFFSSTLIAWGISPRNKHISDKITPIFSFISFFIDKILLKTNIEHGMGLLAPFIYIVGRKR